jgi:hypothetical protein
VLHTVLLSCALGVTSQIGVTAAFVNFGKPWAVIGPKADDRVRAAFDQSGGLAL